MKKALGSVSERLRSTGLLLLDQGRHGGIDTFASVTPQCSVVADLTCLCKRGSFHILHCTLCSSSTPALLSRRQSAAQSAAVRETHVLLTTDAITYHGRVKAGAQDWGDFIPVNRNIARKIIVKRL